MTVDRMAGAAAITDVRRAARERLDVCAKSEIPRSQSCMNLL